MKTLLPIFLAGCCALRVAAQSAPPTFSAPPLPSAPPAAAQEATRQRLAAKPSVTATNATRTLTAPAPSVTVPAPVPTPTAAENVPPPVTPPANVLPAAPPAAEPQPAPPAAANNLPPPANPPPAAAPAPAQPAEELIPADYMDLVGADLDQVFDYYSKLTSRTVLRPGTLAGGPIKMKAATAMTRTEAIQALNSVLALNNISMINVGDKFVKAVPKAQAGQEGAPLQRLDAEEYPESGAYVTHIVQSKFFKPSELQPLLMQFASLGAANAVVAVDSSQTFVLRDNAENVKRMLELIKEVDVAVPSEFISEVIPIKYAMAADIASALSSLSSGGAVTSSGGGAAGGTGRTGTTGRSGMGSMGGRGLGMSGLGQMGQQGMNPLGAAGQQMQPGGQASFTDRLQQIIKKASTTSTGDILVIGPTKIVADERANSLLVFASRTDMSIITNIVAKLDVVLPQVLIEAIIMDVQLGDGYSFGVSYLQHPQQVGNFTGVGGINNLNAFTNPDFGGFTNMTRGFNYFARSGQDLDIVVNASANDSRVNVVQKPRIMTFHAKPASFFIGNTVPYVTSTYYGGGYGYGGGYPSSQYQQLRVGIQLDVTPYINQDGLVVMEISQQIEEISGSTAITGVGDVPNTASRSLSAQVAVKDRETIILGGFIRASEDKAKSGVPILKDIPLLGYLFNKTSRTSERKELLVLMRPTVLQTPELAAAHTAAEKLRLPGISEAEAKDKQDEERSVERAKRRAEFEKAAQAPLPVVEDH